MLTIRKLSQEDLPAFRELRIESLEQESDAFPMSVEDYTSLSDEQKVEMIESRTDAPQRFVLGVFDDNGEMVGMGGFRQEPFDKMRHKGRIWGMYLRPTVRRRGAARQLLERLIDEAKQIEDIQQIYLWVATTSAMARALYTSAGFERWGTESAALVVDGRQVDLHHMVLLL